MSEKPLKPWHYAFITEYMVNGANATGAMVKARPDCTHGTCNAEAGKVLALSSVQTEIQRRIDKRGGVTIAASLANTDRLVTEAEEVRSLALEDKGYAPALQAIDLKARLTHKYVQKSDDGQGYVNLIQKLVVKQLNVANNQVVTTDKAIKPVSD